MAKVKFMTQKTRAATFADKLNQLFESRTKENGQPYTHEEASRVTGITTGAISKLRRGQIHNPSHKVIAAFAKFFDVSPNYFFIYEEPLTEDSEPYIYTISLRAAELSKDGQLALLGMLEEILQREGQYEGGAPSGA
jgi:transcriptional regulator with XRE-family HTH domain